MWVWFASPDQTNRYDPGWLSEQRKSQSAKRLMSVNFSTIDALVDKRSRGFILEVGARVIGGASRAALPASATLQADGAGQRSEQHQWFATNTLGLRGQACTEKARCEYGSNQEGEFALYRSTAFLALRGLFGPPFASPSPALRQGLNGGRDEGEPLQCCVLVIRSSSF